MAILNDSNQAFGGVSLTIGVTAYFAESISVTSGSNTIEIQGANDEITEMIHTDRPKELTATLQLGGNSEPARYAKLTHDSTPYVITEVSNSRGVGEIQKVDITAMEELNGS